MNEISVARRNVLRQFCPAADRLPDHILERQMAEGSALADEARSVEDIAVIAAGLPLGKRRREHLITTATRIWLFRHGSGMGMSRVDPERWTAAAGAPDLFKSDWERRLASALTRLGIGWKYEPRRLRYSDGTTRWRDYVPDFALQGLDGYFVEVKGRSGVDASDAWKMRCVVRDNPWVKLLVWDAAVVEYVEDCGDAERVMALAHQTGFS